MKKFLTGFMFFMLWVSYTKNIDALTWTRSSANGNLEWTAITSSSDGTRLAAVPSVGNIYTSNDLGQTWIPRNGAGTQAWRDISTSADGSILVAGGDGPANESPDYIYISRNYGKTWNKQTSLGTDNWRGTDISSDGQIIVVFSISKVYVSRDGGSHWSNELSTESILMDTSATSASGQKIIILGWTPNYSSRRAQISLDYGDTWVEKTYTDGGSTLNFSAITESDEILFAVGNQGQNSKIYKSTDYGDTWVSQNGTSRTTQWVSIAASNNGQNVLALQNGGTADVYATTDGGSNWTQISSFGAGSNTVYFAPSLDGTKVLAAVFGGYLYTSIDSGSSWVIQNQGATGGKWMDGDIDNSGDVILYNQNTSNGNDFITYSNTSGNSWNQSTLPGSKLSGHWAVHLVADGSKWLVSAYDKNVANVWKLYSSTSIGTSWTYLPVSGAEKEWNQFASNSDGSKLYGAAIYEYPNQVAGHIYQSTDWGSNWSVLSAAGQKAWKTITTSSDGAKIVAAPNEPENPDYIYYSSDSGSSWSPFVEAGSRQWSSVAMSSNGEKIVAGDQLGGVYLSSDSGVSWDLIQSVGTRPWSSVSMSADGTKIIVSSDYDDTDYNWGGRVFLSTNSGSTWTEQKSLGQGSWARVKISPNGNNLLAVAYNGFVYFGHGNGVLTTVASDLEAAGISSNINELEDQSQACGLYFEKANVGKIEFSTCPDLTDSSVISWISNIGDLLNLSTGIIGLDADMVQNFISTQAVLTMYNINMSNPEILVDGEPDTSDVVSNLTYDDSNHTLTFDAAHFTTFEAVEGAGSSSNLSPTSSPLDSNSSSSNSSSSCNDGKPSSIPDLFQIDVTDKSAKLFFTPIANTSKFYISYSTQSNIFQHGVEPTLAREGVQNFTINLLKPSTTYYFKIRGQNGCMPGDWSNTMKITTRPKGYLKTISYYKNNLTKIASITSPTIKKEIGKTTTIPVPTSIPSISPPSVQSPQMAKKFCFLWWCF